MTAKLVVITTGSRGTKMSVENAANAFISLAAQHRDERWLYHGAASGWDLTAAHAVERIGGWQVKAYPVTGEDWRELGRAAGHMRNGDMLRDAIIKADDIEADLIMVSNWDGESPGTKGMLRLGKGLGVRQVFLGAKLTGDDDQHAQLAFALDKL